MKKVSRGIIAVWILSMMVSLLPSYNVAALDKNLQHNSKFDDLIVERGIDVAKWQGNIDWKKVKADGVQFAFIRVAARGYGKTGTLFLDEYAEQNMKGAAEVGIPFGVYIYSQAITVKEAKEEADYILKAIDGYDVELPVVLDFEYADGPGGRLYNAHLSDTARTNICIAFCKRVEKAGYTPMVYANKSMLRDDLNAAAISQFYPIWLAHYTTKSDYAGDYEYWQYSSKGSVDGIKGNVDVNVRYVDKNRVNGLRIESVSPEDIKLAWEGVEQAVGYEIYRRTTEDTEFELLATIDEATTTSYSDTNVRANTKYVYQARAVLPEGPYNKYSKMVSAYCAITKKTTVSSASSTLDSLSIKWKEVEGAEGYEIWKYSTSKKKYLKKASLTEKNNTSFTENGLKAGTTYSYKVRAYRTERKTTIYSPFSETLKLKTTSSEKGRVKAKSLSVRASATTSSKKLTTLKKNTVLTLTGSKGNWYKTSVTIKGKKKTAYVSKSYIEIVKVGKPALKKSSTSFDKVKVTWNKVSGASGYVLQRYSSSKKAYVTVKTIKKGSTVSYTDKNLNASTTYKYRIRAYKTIGKKKVYGSYSTVLSAKTGAAKTGKITASSVNLRKGAGTKYAAVKTMKKGKKITITGSRGSWYRASITVGGKKKTVYVLKKYVKL